MLFILKRRTGFWMRYSRTLTKERKAIMKLITTSLVAFTGLGLYVAPLALAAGDSFVGKWKITPDKSQLNGLTYRVADAGHNQYKLLFGDDAATGTVDAKPTMPKY